MLQFAVVLHKMQESAAAPVDGLQCLGDVFLRERIILHPFGDSVAQRDNWSKGIHNLVGKYPHKLLLRLTLTLLHNLVNVLQ